MNCISFFMEKYPYASISCSKFATPWPSHVLLNSQMPNRVCLCHYDENFIMLLETLCKVHPDIPSYSSQFVARLVCAQPTEHCPNNVCHEWKDGKLFYYTSDGSINRFQWEKRMWIDNKNELRKLRVIPLNKLCKNWKCRCRPLFCTITLSKNSQLHISNILINFAEIYTTQSAFTCSKLTIEMLEQGVKYIQN